MSTSFFSNPDWRRTHRPHLLVIFLVVLHLINIAPVQAAPESAATELENVRTYFNRLWSRNDGPIASGKVARSWTWGEAPFQITQEPYADAPGGVRWVAYWDKSRMEINNLAANPNDAWFISNGLLVKEMVSGRLQTGNSSYQIAASAQVPVAGDPAASNPQAPTYASFSRLASLNNDRRSPNATGNPVLSQIDKAGNTRTDNTLSRFGVRNAYYDNTLGHNIPNVFMNYFSSTGLVYQGGSYKTERVTDWLFAAGLPLTEAYWSTVRLGGRDMMVLVQLFERRVLTYNPANRPEWQVEMGNAGRHYYTWRNSGSGPVATPPVAAAPAPVAVLPVVNNFARFDDSEAGGKILTIGNQAVQRTIVFNRETGLFSNSLLNRQTGEEYLDRTRIEFSIKLTSPNEDRSFELTSDYLHARRFEVITQDSTRSVAEIGLSGLFEGKQVEVLLYYEALAGQNFVRKWLTIENFNRLDWILKGVTLEDWQTSASLQPLVTKDRYEISFARGGADYDASIKNNRIETDNLTQRYQSAAESGAVGLHQNGQEGIYFLAESLFGQESLRQSQGLQIGHTDFGRGDQPSYTSGRSVIGVWQGNPEIGFKRYNEYLYNFYAVNKGKRNPVVFNTWYPYSSGIDEKLLLDTFDRMQSAGFYDILHVDAGWQKGAPLSVNLDRFPQGLDPLAGRLRSAGKGLGLWINPFSGSYDSLEDYSPWRAANPQWVDASRPTQVCPLSGAGAYIRERLLELARNWPLEELYWDGADWNIQNCQSAERSWTTLEEERHQMINYYAGLLRDLHAIRPSLQVILWNAPADLHWLAVVDQLQLSDVSSPPILTSELIRRQQMYFASFQLPYSAIWGDWYGLAYQREWADGLGQPLNLVKYALVSTIGNGATQAGGGVDLAVTPPAVIDFMRQLFGWRKRFQEYFTTYQHVLDFPDGAGIDGEGHIINGRGFIMLYNPTGQDRTTAIPLNEPELELKAGQYYTLSNWSDLATGKAIGRARPGEGPVVTVPAYGYQIIGVNL